MIKQLCLVLTALAIGCSVEHDANKDLRDKLRTRKIMSVEILQIPEDIETPIAVTPESIEKKYHAKLELRSSALISELPAIDRALADTDCKPSTQTINVRTAIIFFDETDTKLKEFYYSTDGWGGQINDVPCELGPGLRSWARKRLP